MAVSYAEYCSGYDQNTGVHVNVVNDQKSIKQRTNIQFKASI